MLQILKLRDLSEIGFNAVKVTIALDHDHPKSSYSVIAKLILDEAKRIRNSGMGGSGINQLITNKIPQLIKDTRNFNELRFSSEFKLRHLQWEMKRQLLIGIFGLDRAGKTSILKSISMGEVGTRYTPTMGHNRFIMSGVLGANWEPVFLEVGGKPEFRSLWSAYDNLDGIIYVVDSSDEFRLEESKKELTNLMQLDYNTEIPLLILFNKQDLPESLSINEIAKIFHIDNEDQQIFPVSASSGEGIPNSLHWFLESVFQSVKRKDYRPALF